MIRRKRFWALCLAAVTCLASVVVVGADKAHQAPRVRLHGGAAWLASSKVGQLTLLDGSTAEVAAKVSVAPPGTPIRSSQLGPTGYALNLLDNSVVRVDGATLEPSQPSKPLGSSLFPTPQTLYLLNSERGLLTPLDPGTLSPQGTPHSLASMADGAIVDGDGRLWVLDQKTGDLAWFTAGTKRSLEGTGPARIAVTDGQPVVLSGDQASLLDPSTGSVVESIRVDVRPDDAVSITGSVAGRRILISIASRGLLMVCTFGAGCQDPVPLGSGGADLGPAVEVDGHAIVPDYSTGRVWIVNLATKRVVVERQLFDRPVQFELLTRDGLVFYNDPDSDQAGVLSLDGNVRAVSKYNPTKPDAGTNQVAMESPNTARQSPPTNRSGPADAVPPVKGPGRSEPAPPPPPVGAPMADIVIKPRNHGLVGDEFELEVVARSPIGIATARWTFGDGTKATGLAVRHRWNRPGEFRVEVAPMLAIGLPARVATATVTIEPAGTPPRIASINIDPAAPQVGEAVRFSARVTGRWPDRWEWTVQGPRGTVATSRQRQFRHTFATPGRYTVTLAVQAGNVRVQQSRQVTVAPEPPPVRCGDVLTASAVLKSDLVCPNDAPVTIAADNVTLDLGGNTLSAESRDTGTGIKVANNRTIQNINIKNGTLANFGTGIELNNVTNARLSNVTFNSIDPETKQHLGAAVAGINARDIHIYNASFLGEIGFSFRAASEVTFHDSNVSAAVSECFGDSSCKIRNSKISGSLLSCAQVEPSSTVYIENSALDVSTIDYRCKAVVITDSRMTPNSFGIAINYSDSLIFTGNTITKRPGPSIKQNPVTVTISSNFGSSHIADNIFDGIDIGLTTYGLSGLIARNTFARNAQAGLDAAQFKSMTVTENVFIANGKHPLDSSRYGGFVYTGDPDSNVSISNNRSSENFGHGIHVENAKDDGGNTSVGDEKGCHGITCSKP